MALIRDVLRFTKIMGIIVFLASILRWTFIYSDISQSIFGMLIGMIIFFGGLLGLNLYDRIKSMDEEIDSLKRTITSLNEDIHRIKADMVKSKV